MKKKVLAFLTAVTMVFGTGGVLPDSITDFSSLISVSADSYGDYEYSILDDGTVEITKYVGNGSKITIPSTIDEKKVTSIGCWAFDGCTSLISITIPDSVTSIGDQAIGYNYEHGEMIKNTELKILCFKNTAGEQYAIENGFDYELLDDNLSKTVDSGTCGDNVSWVLDDSGNLTISGTGKMKSFSSFDSHSPWHANGDIKKVIIQNGVTSIGNCSFYNCKSLTSMTIPESVTSIGDWAFHGCTSLTNINIPNSVTNIGNFAFYGCSSLTSIKIPNNITSISEATFTSCTSLTSVTIPNSVTSIENLAFENCSSLKSIEIPESVKSIGIYTFYSCTSLTNINIPNGVTSIGKLTFYNCTSLKNITIPDSVTDIGFEAFYNCNSLTSIIIPEGVISIGKEAFGFFKCLEVDSDGDIEDYFNSVSYSVQTVPNFKIYCYKGTAGEQYAIDNGFDYELIGESKSITNYTITLGTTSYTYDGSTKKPSVTVKNGSTTLTNGTDYTVSYSSNTNAGTGKVTITGTGKYTGSVVKSFTINAKSISNATVTLSQTSYTYDGNEKEPSATVKDGSKTLNNGTDYTVSYSNNKDVGTATVIVTGKGNYSGISEITFNIISNNSDIFYDEEYGRWYIKDDDGNDMPLICTYDSNNDAWYTQNGKKINVLYNNDVNYPNHEYPDRVAYIVLPNGEVMLLKNFGYYNTIYNTIDGRKVSAIGNYFDVPWVNDGNYGLIDPNKENSGRKITIPDYITYCGVSSMATWGLDELQLSNNLLCIEDSAFMVYDGLLMNNDTLNNLKLNDGLKYIGNKAFFGYSALTSVSIPSSVNYIGDYSFGYYTDIEKLEEDMNNNIDGVSYEDRTSEKYYKKVDNFTIYGFRGTEAERYANKNNFNFIALDKEIDQSNSYIRGDVNSDKKINVTDVSLVAAHVKGIKALKNQSVIIADVNNDSKVNVTDISKIAAHVKGIKALDLSEIPFSDEEDVGEIYFSPVDPDHIATADDGISMYADNEILVVAAEGVTKKQIEELAKSYDAEIVGYIEKTGDYQWKLNSGDPKSVVDELRNNDLLVEVELNYISEVETEDYNVGNRWNSDPHGGTELNQNNTEWWGIDRIKAPAAWRLMEENNPSPVKIGLIDSGFNNNHNDLDFAEKGIFYQNGENGTEAFSEWTNQRIYEVTHHGSHVAGTMAANGQNENGIIGVYPYGNDRLYGVSMYGLNGDYSSDNSLTKLNKNISSMQYKVALSELIVRNVKVINFSMGWNAIDRYDFKESVLPQPEYQKNIIKNTTTFMKRLLDCGYDFIIVCAAGNDSSDGKMKISQNSNGDYLYDPEGKSQIVRIINNNNTYSYLYNDDGNWRTINITNLPQSNPHNNPNVLFFGDIINNHYESEYTSVFSGITDSEIKDRIIVVGSIDNNNEISDFSDAGERVDIFAPGRDIWSTWSEYDSSGRRITTQYHEDDGTSMASPHIAGVAANVWSMNNSLTGKQVKTIVCNSALKDENDRNIIAYTSPKRCDKWICDCEEAVRVAINSRNGVIEFDEGKSNGIIEGWVYNNPKGTSDHDSTWSGIPYIKIEVSEDVDGTGFWRPVDDAKTTTDSDGHFEIIIPDGTYKVTASDDKYGSQSIYNVIVYRNQVTYAEWIVFNHKFSGTISQIPGQDPVHTYSSNSEWAWKEYDHPNYDTSSGYDKHIIIDGDNIKMDGYLEAGYKDFLFVDDNNSTNKVFELDFQRDQTSQYDSDYEWHSMYGGGFLFNASINEEENSISGYYILITQTGLELFEINNMALDTFRDTEDRGELLETFNFDNRFDKHHIKIEVSDNSVSLFDGDNIVIDNYNLNQKYGNGFGPITSHIGHDCEQRSYFTFSNITMQTR